MSIYATMGQFQVCTHSGPKIDNYHEIFIQGVPPHIDYVGEKWGFLPPPVDENGPLMRAVFFITTETKKGSEKNGQEYIDPILMLTGKEFLNIKFVDLLIFLTDKLESMDNKMDLPSGIENQPILFGLEKQSHIPTIKRMLESKRTWTEIGEAIGWDSATARWHYEKYIQKDNNELVALANAIGLLEKLAKDVNVYERNEIASVILQANKFLFSATTIDIHPKINETYKTLGQIAYEASESGGKQNFGEWEKAPGIVKSVHEELAQSVKKAVISGNYKK